MILAKFFLTSRVTGQTRWIILLLHEEQVNTSWLVRVPMY
jgi:hypothetical protein